MIDIEAFYGWSNDYNKYIYGRIEDVKSDDIHKFVDELIRVPLNCFIDTIDTREEFIDVLDIPCISSFELGTEGVCKTLKLSGCIDMSYDQMGYYLLGYGKKNLAYKKYGENQAKLAKYLGLCNIYKEKTCKIFLTPLGNEFIIRGEKEKEEMLYRLIFRMRLFRYILRKAQNEKVDICDEISFLSEATIHRRYSSIKTITKVLNESKEELIVNRVANIR